jgi:hypothetical protein
MRGSIAAAALLALFYVVPATTWSKDETATDPAQEARPAADAKEAVPASSVTRH